MFVLQTGRIDKNGEIVLGPFNTLEEAEKYNESYNKIYTVKGTVLKIVPIDKMICIENEHNYKELCDPTKCYNCKFKDSCNIKEEMEREIDWFRENY